MAPYIDRNANLVTLRSDSVGDSTVRIHTRMVGNTAVVNLTEYSDEMAKPASRTKLLAIVRGESKAHVSRGRAVSDPVADATIVKDTNCMNTEGEWTQKRVRVRSLTFVVAPR